MKYRQFLNQTLDNESNQVIDWALDEAEYFSLVWRKEFKFKKSAKTIKEKLKPHLAKSELTNEWPGQKSMVQ